MLLTQAVSNLPSDASALERSIAALRSSIAVLSNSVACLNSRAEFWEKWPYGFTFAVVVGVAMEWWVIRHDWREDSETWAETFFGLSRTLRPSRLKVWIEYISVALVALGVAGELAIGIAINVINRQLRDANAMLQGDSSQLVALVTQLAGSAAQSSLTAQGAAQKSDSDAKDAQEQSNAVEVMAKAIRVRLGADEDLEAALRKALLPRELDGAQLANAMYRFAGSEVSVVTTSDVECMRTANLIGSSLGNAGWRVKPEDIMFDASPPPWVFGGIEVRSNCAWTFTGRGPAEGKCNMIASQLAGALSSAGLPDVLLAGSDDTIPVGSFIIRVGLRKVPGAIMPGNKSTPAQQQ